MFPILITAGRNVKASVNDRPVVVIPVGKKPTVKDYDSTGSWHVPGSVTPTRTISCPNTGMLLR
jgi:hypothetical protein